MSRITDYHAKYYAWELCKRHPSDQPEKFAGAVANAEVHMNPHQVYAALFAFDSPLKKGAILADEVGLGKTIEAGLVMAQKWAEGKRRILVITPANLRKQWHQELLEKFFLPARILEADSFKALMKGGDKRPFLSEQIVIASYHFVKSKSEEVRAIPWDLVVIDEAHRLRNVYKHSNKIANVIKQALRNRPKILLTATPLQNSLMELYGLVSIVDEHVFGDFRSFRDQFSSLRKDEVFDHLRERIRPVCHRTLRKQVQSVSYTRRWALVEKFTPSLKEEQLYEYMSEYLQRPSLHALPSGQRALITLILRKLLASSTFAIAGAIQTMLDRLKAIQRNMEHQPLEVALDEDFEALDEVAEEWDADEGSVSDDLRVNPEGLRAEIKELEHYLELAKSITENQKGLHLLNGLQAAFEKTQQLGAQRKAIIFTESRKTQDYLMQLLTHGKFAEKDIVLFNGTNTDKRSKEIYQEWLARHQGSDRVTGSKTADMRSALVDYFREKATVMIATEAGAEGINLQFCSLVVNFDLPWNPQRIEQRIGRCHRYGQKHDVVVLNFLNANNAADARVYDLLSEKFRLFEGVFGASDEVLGAIGSGVDFEKRVAEIYQNCRDTEEIQAEFDRLQTEMREELDSDMKEARRLLLENFDEEVLEKLRGVQEKTEVALRRHEQLLMDLSRHALAGCATFEGENRFRLHSHPLEGWGFEAIPLGMYELPRGSGEAHTYRPEHPLAQCVREMALDEPTPMVEVSFDLSGHGTKITLLEELAGEAGYLMVKGLRVNGPTFGEDYTLVACLSDDGLELPPDAAIRLMNVAGKVTGAVDDTASEVSERVEVLQGMIARQKQQVIEKVELRFASYFDQEVNKLESWADDRKSQLEAEIKDIDRQIRDAKGRASKGMTLQEKLDAQKEVKALEAERNKKRRELFETQDKIDSERDILIAETEKLMQKHTQEVELFVIRWRLV